MFHVILSVTGSH